MTEKIIEQNDKLFEKASQKMLKAFEQLAVFNNVDDYEVDEFLSCVKILNPESKELKTLAEDTAKKISKKKKDRKSVNLNYEAAFLNLIHEVYRLEVYWNRSIRAVGVSLQEKGHDFGIDAKFEKLFDKILELFVLRELCHIFPLANHCDNIIKTYTDNLFGKAASPVFNVNKETKK